MNMKIIENIDSGKAPLINGFLYPDGTLYQIIISQIGRNIFHLEKYHEKKIDSDLIEWIEYDVVSEIKLSKSGRCVKAGEGAFGGDGFVLLKENDRTEWIAFFENSNPLSIVEADDERVIVESDLGLKLAIPYYSPQNLLII